LEGVRHLSKARPVQDPEDNEEDFRRALRGALRKRQPWPAENLDAATAHPGLLGSLARGLITAARCVQDAAPARQSELVAAKAQIDEITADLVQVRTERDELRERAEADRQNIERLTGVVVELVRAKAQIDEITADLVQVRTERDELREQLAQRPEALPVAYREWAPTQALQLLSSRSLSLSNRASTWWISRTGHEHAMTAVGQGRWSEILVGIAAALATMLLLF
jgi:DNA repair exonuclease SbcCD ATPase subunit